jgi:hypothetical protein
MEEEDSQNQQEAEENRRKGLERRWIKSKYSGPERRTGQDRRAKKPKPKKIFNPDDTL